MSETFRVLAGFILSILLLFGGCAGFKNYQIWSERKSGEAELARAEGNKRILVESARAQLEAAQYQADAEIARAKGVAEANRIVGDSLKGNEAYLRYRYIENLAANSADKATATIIYVPTEAGLPILESGRLRESNAGSGQ